MKDGLYTANEVAEIIADLFGDTCACNFNNIDEWLPLKCELIEYCPNTCGVACWEQYLKYRHCKNENLEKAWRAAKASLEAFYENAKAMGEI